jgi:hypothetical protein
MADFTFTGTSASALNGGSVVWTNATTATLTFTSATAGTDNVVTVLGSAQLTQATSVAAVVS